MFSIIDSGHQVKLIKTTGKECFFVSFNWLRPMQNFAQLLQAPLDDANAIIGDRFPAPRLVVCDQYGSQVSVFSQHNMLYPF
jgi:hypothetical protein